MQIFLILVWNNFWNNFPIWLPPETGPKETEHKETDCKQGHNIAVPMRALGGKQQKLILTWAKNDFIGRISG